MTTTVEVRERPILFSGEMVRAILEGRKTQTRRVIKPQPKLRDGDDCVVTYGNRTFSGPAEYLIGAIMPQFGCPYGQPGDRLLVRESFQPLHTPDMYPDWETGRGYDISYPATEGRREYLDWNTDSMTDRLSPGIHMPRWASRITLEITKVRVERVQEIGHKDIAAEGVGFYSVESSNPYSYGQSKKEFEMLWNKINAKRGLGWKVNPWVWVIEFRRLTD